MKGLCGDIMRVTGGGNMAGMELANVNYTVGSLVVKHNDSI